MAEYDFLRTFIKEPVYVIKGEELPQLKEEVDVTETRKETEEIAPKPEEIKTTPAPKTEVPAAPTLNIKGNASGKVFVLVNESGVEFISPQNEDFLSKILKAVKLDIKEVAIINLANNESISQDTLFKYNSSQFLLFGVDDNTIFNKNLAMYELESISEKQLLNCAALDIISNTPTEKKLLWNALQKMFL